MPNYLSGYDTEPIYPWWESNPLGRTYDDCVSYEGARLQEAVEGVRAVAEVHLRHECPATWFIVAKLAEVAGHQLRDILDSPLFEVASHSYTHPNLMRIKDDAKALRYELIDSKKLIEDIFDQDVIGLTGPGGYEFGISGEGLILETVAEAGYGYVRMLGVGPHGTVPVPLNQPFWYTQDGFPDLLEIPTHAWHDNILTGQPSLCYWPPVIPWPYPTKVAETGREVYEAYAPGLDHIAEYNMLTYTPALHPWSIYSISRSAEQIKLLLSHAKKVGVRPTAPGLMYKEIVDNPSLAADRPTWTQK